MHKWYLRELYLRNRLIQPGALTVAGEPLDLTAIGQPVYAAAAVDDHILRIVNPPVHPPKRKYWADTAHRSDSTAQWKSRAAEHAGSWWPDWMDWLKPRAGELIAARPVDSAVFPTLAPAPGSYVLES